MMATRVKQVAAPFLLFVLSLGCSEREDDLDALCEVAAEVRADPSVEPDRRVREALRRWQPSGEPGRQWKESLPHAPPSVLYDLVRTSAAEEGVEGWSCPALEALSAEHPSSIEPPYPGAE